MRIGTTSFIRPGGWHYNVELFAPIFDDIEILFFESEGPDAFPGASERLALTRSKRTHGLSYSLHTPLKASLASEDGARRAAGVRAVMRSIDAARDFDPELFVVHVYLGEGEHGDRPRDLVAWRERAAQSLSEVLRCGVEPRKLCVESLDYDPALIAPLLEELDLSLALDVGHLVRDGADELDALARHFPRTRIIQWHGTEPGGRDHRSLVHYPRERARALLSELLARRYTGVLTLEVFRERDLCESHGLVRSMLTELGAPEVLREWTAPAPSA